MASRILALLIWAAVAATIAFWGLRWLGKPTPVPSNAMAVSLDNAARGDLRKLLTGPAEVEADTPNLSAASALGARLKLLGVVAPRHQGDVGGLALLSIDSKPPRAVRAGATVDGDMVLRSISQRGVEIGPASGPTTVKLDLPGLPAASTGSLPPPSGITTEPSVAAPAPVGQQMSSDASMASPPADMPAQPPAHRRNNR
ncbi:MAG: hypothetical protein KGL90_06150 [Burkholderiales bacterium]|nr:hypothetical protein [Burkholderiales bacterium]